MHLFFRLLAAVALVAPLTIMAGPAAAEDPCRSVLADPICDAVPDPDTPPGELCGEVFASEVCDALPGPADVAELCEDPVPAEACALVAAPTAAADAALCDAAQTSVRGGCLRWSVQLEDGFLNTQQMVVDATRGVAYVVGAVQEDAVRLAVRAVSLADGSELWTSVLATNGAIADAALSPDGERVVFAGRAGSGDMYLVALDTADGQPAWTDSFNGGYGFDTLSHVAFSGDGSRLVASGTVAAIFFHWHCSGFSCFQHSHFHTDVVTLAYDAVPGTRVWLARSYYSPDYRDLVSGIAVSHDGSRVYAHITSQYYSSYGGPSYVVTFGHNGGVIGQFSLASSAIGQGLVGAPDGTSVYAITPVAGGPRIDALVHGTTLAWSWQPPSGGAEAFAGAAISPDGATLYFATYTYAVPAGERQIILRALDTANGEERWKVASEKASTFFGVRLAALQGDGGVALAAAHVGASTIAHLARYDELTGSRAWNVTLPTPALQGLAAGADGDVLLRAAIPVDGAYQPWLGLYEGGLLSRVRAALA